MLSIISQNPVLLFSTVIIAPMHSWKRKQNYCGKGHATRTHTVTAETGSDFTYATAGRRRTEIFQEESSESRSSETEPCWQNDLMGKGKKMTMSLQCTMANDIQEKTVMEPGRTEIQLCKQTQHRQSYISTIFCKSPRIYLRVFSDFVILSIHAYL